ncbi:hypothetical protein BC939DRAFT_183360 [Gamsiella multidivaricata]|uniref:uncharacterized protein n=1 Tax=Gamsiella multidivaricata TaxID=101098 RepID=UPI00221E73F5|nr:uncharacterized protein BC939DRAFT_183360 [Gamsiella multidivaricata]KAG0363953.1 hypothetical protein BGZ54_007927 [Gamsiella multidivaricata]KAI7822405.1 hypothetical protein BC939DRAFT_183360 [Gamsiella multidivaricata]
MTIKDSGQQSSQAFRLRVPPNSSAEAEVVTIPTRLDPKSGQRIILWRDIQLYYKDAQCVMNDGDVILYLTDENFEYLTPLRIGHYPGVILDVIVGSTGQEVVAPATEEASLQRITPVSTPTISPDVPTYTNSNAIIVNDGAKEIQRYNPPYCMEIVEINSLAEQTADLSVQDVGSPNHHLVVRSTDMAQEPTVSVQDHLYHYTSQLLALQSGQRNIAEAMQSGRSDIVATIKGEMDKNRSLQEQVLQMQRQMDRKDRRAQDRLFEAQQQLLGQQKQMLKMQQQALDRLAIIQNRVQAVLTQTYELHEYPIPRLFIVLPKALRRRDKLLKPFSEQFRLYFLCECGAHTMSEGTTIPHEIHLAKHEGYDLDRPKEFFEKYGSYVLALMQMIKFGISVAGVVVPPLAHFKVVEGIEEVERHLKFVRENLEPLVDDTIHFIEGQQKNPSGGMELTEGQTQMDKLEVLEGADLRQLESYLKVQDESRVLGNLYRIVTAEGHVKWVCIDHYRENYRESTVQQLRDIVEANGGVFAEAQGKIKISLTAPTLAKQFYEALVKSRHVHELEVSLRWDTSLDDLRKLTAAVTTANIIRLSLLYSFQGPALDYINRNRRFRPIMELMSNGRVQSLELLSLYADVPIRFRSSYIKLTSQLRTLSIKYVDLEDTAANAAFAKLLQNCPSLVELKLSTQDPSSGLKTIMDSVAFLSKLRMLELYPWVNSKNQRIIVNLLKGSIQIIWASIFSIGTLQPIYLAFLQDGRLTRLSIAETVREEGDASLAEMLRRNPKLTEVNLRCEYQRFAPIIDLTLSTRKEGRLQGRTCAPLQLELQADSDLGDDLITSTVHFADDSAAFDMSTRIKMGQTSRPSSDHLPQLFSRYGWSIKILEAISGTLNDDLALKLDKTTEDNEPKLATLMLDPSGLSPAGVASMDRVMSRSDQLQDLRIYLKNPLFGDRGDRRLLHRHREKLTELAVNVTTRDSHIPRLAKIFPTRRDVPKLKSLYFRNQAMAHFPQEFIPWLVAMISAPNNPSVQKSPLPESMRVPLAPPSIKASTDTSPTWEPLREFKLLGFLLQPQDWRTLIEALDVFTLETLDFRYTNFSVNELRTLVQCIPDNSSEVVLKYVYLKETMLSQQFHSSEIQSLCATLEKKAPLAEIQILGI